MLIPRTDRVTLLALLALTAFSVTACGDGTDTGDASAPEETDAPGNVEPGPGLAVPDIQVDAGASSHADAAGPLEETAVGDDGSSVEAGPCDGLEIRIVRQVTWPAGGSELTLRVLNGADGTPRLEDVSDCITLDGSGGLAQAVKRVALQAEHLVLVLSPPSGGEDPSELAAAATEFLHGRPEGERIALFGWGAQISQLAGYSADRGWLSRQVSRWFESDHGAGANAGLAEMVTYLDSLAAVGGDGPRGLRAVVVFGEAAEHVGEAEARSADASFVLAPAAVGSLEHADATLRDLAEQAFYNLGACHSPDGASAVLQPGGAIISLDETRPGERGVPSIGCDPTTIASGARPYTRRIAFEFTDSQLDLFKERLGANSKADFEVSVRLWPDGDAVPAVAHLRGRGSLGCSRRNYTLNLDGPRHHLIPGSSTDEFYLISMCLDDRYVNQLLGDGLMARLGVFPARYRLVEFALPSGTKGVYLLMEKVAESLVEGNVGVESVIRRATDIDGKTDEVKYSVTSDEQALSDYHAFRDAAGDRSGEELIAWLEDRVALDDYLRWIAFNTLVRNGDYIDEMWFFGVQGAAADGSTLQRYGVMGWDPDDLFSDCHYNGGYAIDAPQGLLYCTESLMDHAIFADPMVFERYVDHLEIVLLQDADEAAVAEVATWMREHLLPYFEDPAVAAAMKELVAKVPAATDPAVAIAEIDGKLTELQQKIESRRAELLAAIATWREGQR